MVMMAQAFLTMAAEIKARVAHPSVAEQDAGAQRVQMRSQPVAKSGGCC